jgi:predicted signal transduction protein with EAL and GGDEF domain
MTEATSTLTRAATLRNYRKDGSMFWNELSISPIYDIEGSVTHFIGIQKDVTARVLLQQQLRDKNQSLEEMRSHLERLAMTDSLTGIYNRRFFDSQLDVQSRISRRTGQALTLMMVDVIISSRSMTSMGILPETSLCSV